MYEKNKNEKARIKPRFISLLVYLNDEWDPEWGGETKFLDEDSQIGLLVAAKPGRVVLFDSDVKHSACATMTMPPRDDESNNKQEKVFAGDETHRLAQKGASERGEKRRRRQRRRRRRRRSGLAESESISDSAPRRP